MRQILREINFGIFGVQRYDFQLLYTTNMVFLDVLNSQKVTDRKIMKFSHCLMVLTVVSPFSRLLARILGPLGPTCLRELSKEWSHPTHQVSDGDGNI